MTPDREPGEVVLDRDATPLGTERTRAAREAALAAGPVPAPRPEVLARVLEGLRGLPAATRPTDDGAPDAGGDPGLPLPRRRS